MRISLGQFAAADGADAVDLHLSGVPRLHGAAVLFGEPLRRGAGRGHFHVAE
ncbi:hypothetical protein [Streptomyces globisporus]|uniref:hypothetical protein n=1 Tax=Streptomyces globisporus TaxID=1908 RepID=UPI001404C045|nr:hypothetical protein [Streptomyces globisporus]